MLKELFDAMRNDILKAAGPAHVPIDRTKDYAVFDREGTPSIALAIPQFRRHQAQDLQTVAEFAKRFHDTSDEDDENLPSIWYSRNAVVCLTDDDDRRDSVTFSLVFSDPIRKLIELEKGKAQLAQRDAIFMLRTIFKDCMSQCPELVAQLRQVKSSAGQTTDAVVQKGKSSVGKSISFEASGIGELPDYVTLTVPVFHNLNAPLQSVCCVLELFEQTPSFQLFPTPGEIEKAMQAGESFVAETLGELLGDSVDNIPVYYGNPNC